MSDDDFTVTGDELDRCLDRAERAERERDDYKDRWEILGRVSRNMIERLEADKQGAVDQTETFLRFAWEAYTRDVGHPPGWDWRDKVDALRTTLGGR